MNTNLFTIYAITNKNNLGATIAISKRGVRSIQVLTDSGFKEMTLKEFDEEYQVEFLRADLNLSKILIKALGQKNRGINEEEKTGHWKTKIRESKK